MEFGALIQNVYLGGDEQCHSLKKSIQNLI